MCTNKCNVCDKLVKSTSLVLEEGKRLIINIPTPRVVANNEEYCLVICQSIPAGTTTEQVVFCWANGTVVNFNSLNGNYVRADQLCTRKKYKVVFGTDPIHYSLRCPIKCSSKNYTLTSVANIKATRGIISETDEE